MKTREWTGRWRTQWMLGWSLVIFAVGMWSAGAQGYRAGDIIQQDFGFVNRYQWTNDTGDVFLPNLSTIRLSDFDGKIVFFAFFDVW